MIMTTKTHSIKAQALNSIQNKCLTIKPSTSFGLNSKQVRLLRPGQANDLSDCLEVVPKGREGRKKRRGARVDLGDNF